MAEASTGEITPSKTRTEIMKEAERIEEALLHSSKNHFSACRIWTNFHLWLGIPIVAFAAIASAAALVRFDPNGLIAGGLAILVAVMTAVSTFVNANEKAATHLNAGNGYDALMNEVRIFRVIDCWSEESDRVLTERIKRYSERKDVLNRAAPAVPKFARTMAKKGIESGEGDYKVDANQG